MDPRGWRLRLRAMMGSGAAAPRLSDRGGSVAPNARITSAEQAANDRLVLAFGWLQGAANRLEYILGRAIEQECGISHLMFEVLLILGRAGGPGMSMGSIAQERVLTTGGVTRLVDRMVAAGLVTRDENPEDRRGRLVRLTASGRRPWCGPPVCTRTTCSDSSSTRCLRSIESSSHETCAR
jgi:hypothetical protein